MKNYNLRDIRLEKRRFFDKVAYEKGIIFNGVDLKCKGSKFQLINFKPKSNVKPHYHKKTTEIFYIKEGRGIIKLNNKEFSCKKDDVFLCEPNDMHEFINNNNEDFIILIFKTNEEEGDIYWE